jgi:type IV secretory pathway VirD2 relaxase
MSERDDFDLWLGRIGDHGGAARKRFSSRVIRSANLAGGRRRGGPSQRRFDGSRIGRGSGVGRLLGSNLRGFDPSARRVVVKTSIVRLGAKGLGRATAHMRYLQRDGTTREGERGTLYSAELDQADGKAFVERGSGDRHQFRFIVAPEDGSEYEDLKPLVRRLMAQAERDLDTRLDWVAVDHFNTGHPHSHVLVRGRDALGKDLIIAREYLTHGLRERATDLVNLDLGPRAEWEIAASRAREVEQERFTGLDRRVLARRDPDNMVDPRHRDPVEHDLRVARLRRLGQMGLAEEMGGGRWRLHGELEPILRRMGERGDIIRMLGRELRTALPERAPQDQAIYDPKGDGRLVGRLVSSGLADEHADRRYLILDALDGRSHFVDIGGLEIEARPGAVLSVGARPVAARPSDHRVAEVAAEYRGRYSFQLHRFHDPDASDDFITAHIRRLEAIRRATGGAEREADGTWHIAADHLAKAEEYERRLSARTPVTVEVLSARPVERLPEHDGATWLDRELVSDRPERLERGFGAEVRKAIGRRRQWLMAERLAELDGDTVRYRPDMVAALERRELNRVAARLSRELGLGFADVRTGDHVDGVYRRPINIGDRKFALIENSREFCLVPWRPVLERQIGREVAGIVRDGGISWTIGRSLGLSR